MGWAMGSCPGQNWAIRNGPKSDQATIGGLPLVTKIILIHVFTICIINIILN